MTNDLSISAALIGCGYWGRNLLRNLQQLPQFELRAVYDESPERQAWLRDQAGAQVAASLEKDILENSEIEAVVIATPAATHAELAIRCLNAGKHVMVEKSLALNTEDAAALVQLADEKQLTLMVGHTFLYNAAVLFMRDTIAAGDLGEVYYIEGRRLSLGIVRRDVDAMWNLAPHDVSIANFLLDEQPSHVRACGNSFLVDGHCDVQFLHLRYPSGRAAHLHVGWLHPRKVREMTIVGSRQMMVFDDVKTDGKIEVYDKGIDREPIDPEASVKKVLDGIDSFSDFQLVQRIGELRTPTIDFREPLAEELSHFANCIKTGQPPRTDGRNGYSVVAVLQAASQSIENGGVEIAIETQL
jgi:predicted dehydrogenase